MLMEKKNLAKTSSEPGKTRLINHFIVNNEWYLVDLPGYGYAKALRSSREKMDQIYPQIHPRARQSLLCDGITGYPAGATAERPRFHELARRKRDSFCHGFYQD